MKEGDTYDAINQSRVSTPQHKSTDLPPSASPSDPSRSLKPSDVIIGDSESHYRIFKVLVPVTLILLTVIIASFSLYLFLKNDLLILEERNLIAGAEIPLEGGDTVDLLLEEGEIPLKISLNEEGDSLSVAYGDVVSTSSSEGNSAAVEYLDSDDGATATSSLLLEDEVGVDVDNDGLYDLAVRLVTRRDGSKGFIFRRIRLKGVLVSEELPTEPRIDRVVVSEGATASGDVVKDPEVKDKLSEREQCALLSCSEDQVCGYLSGSAEMSCLFKTCGDYGGTVCSLGSYCMGKSILSDIKGDNTRRKGCCLGTCLTIEQTCSKKELFRCEEKSFCKEDTILFKRINGDSFACCTAPCVSEENEVEKDEEPYYNPGPEGPDCSDGIDNDNSGGTDALIEAKIGEPMGAWYLAPHKSCSVFCESKELENIPSPKGDHCSSGENIIGAVLELFGSSAFSKGCWPSSDCKSQPFSDGLKTFTEGSYCYAPQQAQDADPTDLTIACYCGSTAPACSNGFDDDGDGVIDMEDEGCASEEDVSEVPHDPSCEEPYQALEGQQELVVSPN